LSESELWTYLESRGDPLLAAPGHPCGEAQHQRAQWIWSGATGPGQGKPLVDAMLGNIR